MATSAQTEQANREKTQTLVIGAGPGGLAVAACLARAGIPYLVLEQTDSVGIKWRQHYDRLHLHTVKQFSALPHMAFDKQYARYPARQQVVRYLEDYAHNLGIKPRFNQTVKSVYQHEGVWHIDTQNAHYAADNVVIATGYNRVPYSPTWPGMEQFKGDIEHSAEYKTGQKYKGKQVLVVGFGNSGAEIALDLWEHSAKSFMAVRSPVNVLPREVLGMPTLAMGIWQRYLPPKLADWMNRLSTRLLVGDLSRYGLRSLERGPMEELAANHRVPMLDVGTIDLIRRGEILVYPGIERFEERGVIFTDGRRQELDALVLATGYRARVDEILKLSQPVLDDDGCPVVSGAESLLPGLFFCGYYVSPAGMFREMAIEAKQIVAAIKAS